MLKIDVINWTDRPEDNYLHLSPLDCDSFDSSTLLCKDPTTGLTEFLPVQYTLTYPQQ